MKASIGLMSACASLALLSGCGGGSSSNSTPASVTKVTTDQVVYRKVTNFTITGQNLDKGYNASIPACLTITELPGGSSTQRILSCKIVGVGTSNYTITAGSGLTLYNGMITVPLAAQPQVTMTTSMGTMVVELNPAKAPISVDNFLQYVENGFYPNKIFHRVIKGQIIQGGGFTSDLQQPTTLSPIRLETPNGLSNLRGTIAMARTSVADSATAQFYMNVADNTGFDATTAGTGYAVFGKIVTGLDIMDKINAVPTTTAGGMTDVPVTPVLINSMVQTQ